MAEYTGQDYIEQALEEIGKDPQFLPAGTNIGPRPKTSNAVYRAMMKQARQACNANGGFRVGSGDNFQCKFGQDAIDHIESLGENSPAYERGQQWLENNPVDPNASTVDDDTTQQTAEDTYNEEIAQIEESTGVTLENTLGYFAELSEIADSYPQANPLFEEGFGPFTEGSVTVLEDGTLVADDPRTSTYGYVGGENSVEVLGDIGDTSTGVLAEEILAEREQQAAEDAAAEDLPPLTVGGAVEDLQEAFPTWEDLWGKVKDSLPSNPQEWGGAIRGVIEAAGVDLPSGDIWEILNGGYGVTTPINPSTGGIAGILDPANQMVFVPGIPVGLPPSSVIVGSVEDLMTDPIGTITGRVGEIFGGIVQDPGGFVQDILAKGADVPPELWSVLVGGVQAGQDIIDWVTGVVSGDGEETTPESTVVSGAEKEEEEAKLGFGHEQPTEQVTEQVTEQLSNNTTQEPVYDWSNDGLTFGGESSVPSDYDPLSGAEDADVVSGGGDDITTLFSGIDTTVFDEPPVTTTQVLSGGGGGSSGGGGGSSAFSPFWAGISYNTPTVAPIIQTPRVASLFKDIIG